MTDQQGLGLLAALCMVVAVVAILARWDATLPIIMAAIFSTGATVIGATKR
jgi:hypothetical protein